MAEERESWGGGKVTVAPSCPELVLGGKTHTRSKNLQESCSSACFLRASRVPLQRLRSPCPGASCPQRQRVEAVKRPSQPAEGGEPGAPRALKSAPSPLRRTSFPAPTHRAQPLGETRRKRVASLSGSTEVERSWWLPRAGGLCEQPGRGTPPPPRSLRGCLPPLQPQRGRRGAGRGSGAHEELEIV